MSDIRDTCDVHRSSIGRTHVKQPHCPDTPENEKASSDRETLYEEQDPTLTESRREVLTPVYSGLYDEDYDDDDWPDDEDLLYDVSEWLYDKATLIRGMSEFSGDPDMMTKRYQNFIFAEPP